MKALDLILAALAVATILLGFQAGRRRDADPDVFTAALLTGGIMGLTAYAFYLIAKTGCQ
jgi:hypothetical protein